jgi:site-specific DNA-methyltransferase (adenine-specific)
MTGASKASYRGLEHSGRHGGLADLGGNIKDGTNTIRGHDDNGGSAARFFYCAKASRSERNAGLEGMEEHLFGQSGGAQQALKNGESEYLQDSIGLNKIKRMQNHHPTVKPLELMRYLVRLTKTPTGGVVLDPFMGSGTTGCACVLENRDFIGIEKEAEYIEIAQKRIGYYQTPLEKFANGNENYD